MPDKQRISVSCEKKLEMKSLKSQMSPEVELLQYMCVCPHVCDDKKQTFDGISNKAEKENRADTPVDKKHFISTFDAQKY